MNIRIGSLGFLGWFGPRGIASILYIFTVLEEGLANEALIYNVVMLTVLISVFAHGLSAAPLAKRYTQRIKDIAESEDVEMKDVAEMPFRRAHQ